MANEVSKTGVFVDSKTGKVVTSQPVEGRLLVAPGDELTDEAKAAVEAAKTAAKYEVATAPSVETAADTVKAPAKRASK